MKRLFSDSSSYGKLMLLVSILISVPILIVPFYPEEAKYIPSFLYPAIITFIFGIIVCLRTQNVESEKIEPSAFKNGSITVLFIWIYGFIVGSLPFIWSGQLSVVQALFESVSGWTTTGLSVMDVTITPNIFLFHRGFMQFSGGLGFVMVMVMFIQGKQVMSLYNAEGHPDKLMPNLGKTARTIFLMYITFLGVGTILYMIFGMNLFDGLLHSMCALSTGGFSTKVDSIGAYNSLPIEAVTIILMLIGTTNFAVLLLLTRRKIRQIVKVSETRFMIKIFVIIIPIVFCSLLFGLYLNVGDSLRIALFNVVSALSTTGYSTMSYSDWPMFSIGIMILLMLIGGGMGSTAGGIKLSRVYLMLRIMKENIKRRMLSSRTVSKPYYYRAQGKTYIDRTLESDTVSFISCYMAIFIIGTLLITLTEGSSLSDAMFEFASTLGTVGLSIGITGPLTNPATLIVQMIGMMLGRLEIFIVIIGIYSCLRKLNQFFYKKNSKPEMER